MTAKPQLGRIETVPIREAWPHEALDFTKWLAREENLALLGKACSIDLEPIETESSVGAFSVDILAQEAGTGRKVIVENQFKDTDHDHLGKVITYAAGEAAEIIIWVVERAREEHRHAVEWLNSHTDDECSFFLVEIEVWRIGDSPMAPRFNVVESPNEWARAEKSKSDLSGMKRLQLEYWQTFRENAPGNTSFSSVMHPPRADSGNATQYSIGSSRYYLSALIDIKRRRIGVDLYIPNDKEFGQVVFSRQKELEDAVGVPGQRFDAKKACGIRFYLEDRDVTDREEWPSFIEWQIKSLVALRDAVLRIDA